VVRKCAVGTVCWVVGCGAAPEPAWSDAPLQHSAYVWQRAWSPEVRAAVASADGAERVVLVREADAASTVWTGFWSADGQPVRNPPATWAPSGEAPAGEVALALRWNDPTTALQAGVVSGGVAAVLERARAMGVGVSSVHLDADIPTGRLADWAAVVRGAARDNNVKVAVLTLVDHVGKPGWETLTDAVDAVVVQVHSVPIATKGGPVLLDLPTADRALRHAVATSAAPVWLALPTHTLTHATTGAAVRAEPALVAPWVGELIRRHPPGLAGVVWFRLPVEGDDDTWTTETWAAVRAGTVPESTLSVVLEHPPVEWGAGPSARAVMVAVDGPDHRWLPTLDVCVDTGRLLVAPTDPRYRERPRVGDCVRLTPRTDSLLAPGGQEPVALVLAEHTPRVVVVENPERAEALQ